MRGGSCADADPQQPAMTFTYDNVGNRITREDYSCDDTRYPYDDLNRLTAIASLEHRARTPVLRMTTSRGF